MEEMITIEILNWEKYHDPRHDVKNPTWFRLDNSLNHWQSIHDLTSAQRWVFVSLLCVASRSHQNHPDSRQHRLQFHKRWFGSQCGPGVKIQLIDNTIKKLEKAGLIKVLTAEILPCTAENLPRQTRQTEKTEREDTTDSATDDGGGVPFLNVTERETEDAPCRNIAPPTTPDLKKVWNENAEGLWPFKVMTPERTQLWQSMWEENPDLNYWVGIIQRLSQSDFCRGGGKNKWRADVDFFLRPATHVQVLEGRYDTRMSQRIKVSFDEEEASV